MSTTKITLAQSEPQQQALFGYVVGDEKAFEQVQTTMEVAGNFAWLNPYLSKLWTAIVSYRTKNSDRHPTRKEIENSPEVLEDESAMQKRLLKELELSIAAKADFEYLALERDLRNWQRAVIIDKDISEMARKYNGGDIPAAIEVIDKLHLKLDSIRDTLSNKFEEAGSRAEKEEVQRLEQSKRLLKYGIAFFDDSLGGISPNDLILIGAKAGAGKTQTVTDIALTNAEEHAVRNPNPKRVAFFALEAEEHEIERRIKYQLLFKQFVASAKSPVDPVVLGRINYANWRLGKIEEYLGKYNQQVNDHMKKWLKNLRTFYRTNGDFGVDELEKAIVKVAKDSDLIIVDHLHYIDVDGDNENREYKRIVKKLRDLVLGFSKPIIVVAHLRKTFGRNAPLVPQLEDFHGSSDIGKIATTAIILGPAKGHVTPIDPHLKSTWPTFMRISKCRLDGSRLYYVGVGYYDARTGRYRDNYSIGHLAHGDTEWYMIDPESRPEFSRERGSVLIVPQDGP